MHWLTVLFVETLNMTHVIFLGTRSLTANGQKTLFHSHYNYHHSLSPHTLSLQLKTIPSSSPDI